MWNLDPKPSCGTFTRKSLWSFYPEPSWQTFLRNVYVEPLCGTSGTWTFKSVAFLCNLGTFIYGTWELVRVEPHVEPWGTWFQVSGGPKPPRSFEEAQAFQTVGELESALLLLEQRCSQKDAWWQRFMTSIARSTQHVFFRFQCCRATLLCSANDDLINMPYLHGLYFPKRRGWIPESQFSLNSDLNPLSSPFQPTGLKESTPELILSALPGVRISFLNGFLRVFLLVHLRHLLVSFFPCSFPCFVPGTRKNLL